MTVVIYRNFKIVIDRVQDEWGGSATSYAIYRPNKVLLGKLVLPTTKIDETVVECKIRVDEYLGDVAV